MMLEPLIELSVNRLLDELCKSLYIDKLTNRTSTSGLASTRPRTGQKSVEHEAIPIKLLRRCKNRAYEILLKKNPVVDAKDEGFAEISDPLFEIRFSQFEYDLYVGQMRTEFEAYGHLSENIKKRIAKKHAMFAECVESIVNCSYFGGEHSDGHAILMLLVLLRGHQMESMHDEDESIFGLNVNALPELRLSEPKWCRLNWPQSQIERNPYCAENAWRILNGNYKPSLFATPLNATQIAFGTKFDVSGGLHLRRKNRAPVQQLPQTMSAERRQSQPRKKASTAIQYTSNKWEQLGQRFVLRESDDLLEMPFEPKFASEIAETTLHIAAAKALANHQVFEANIVPTQKFIEHLKSLLVGIESDSFFYCETTVSFQMVTHLTVDDSVLPESIEHFVRDFIECGTCYKRLKLIIKMKHDGFLFRAMSASFDKYLETFRRVIIFGNDRTLVELVLRVTPLIKQLRVLAKVLAIHPDDNGKDIPRGSEFLGYLYRQIIGVTQADVSALLVFILTECCDIYFRNFENWIFHGVIDDPCKELFVEFVNHYRPKTKFYFDKAYFIKRQSVPGFLQGYESSILLCGKYANLLKLYKPTHALFSLSPPSINVCLSFDQLKKLEQACHEYKRQAQSVCGPPISVADVFKRKADRQREMVRRVAQKCQRDLEQWRVERDVRENDIRERKEGERLILLQQIQETREQKIQKRREQLTAEREYLRQSEQVELELVERENAQRQRNIDYYTELGAIVDAQRKRTEDEMEKLKRQLKSRANANASEEERSTVSSPISAKIEDNESDDDSEYFDAQKSLSPEIISALPRSASDFLNSNAADSPTGTTASETQLDRQRNRANVLTSNIQLSDETVSEPITPTKAPKNLTDAQQNKLKMLQQEFNLFSADPNSNEIQVRRMDMTDLQRNRSKVLMQEYGTPTATVIVPSERQTEFQRNRKAAMGHDGWDSEHAGDCNANQLPMTDLQRNRNKVLTQEYNFADSKSMSSSMSSSMRSRLKASLSLDLDSGKKKSDELAAKSCQSDFVNSPMSTTSDGPLLEADTIELPSSNAKANDDQKINLKLDTEKAALAAAIESNPDSESFLTAVEPTPFSALNTAGILSKQNGFVFDRTPLCQPPFSQMIRPTFSATNFFDIVPRLNSVNGSLPVKVEPKERSEPSANTGSHTSAELRALNVANLTDFLQQSFTIPLQVYLSLLNNEILKIFFEEFDILEHFKSLRHYFFMMDGEFASNISDGILSKLHKVRKPSELMNSHVLHSILENALHSSIIGNDKNAENLSFCIPNIPERFDMASPNVLKELHLSYKVDWPLNLLLSHETIEHYGIVFQHLLKLRRITWLLDQCFYKLKDIRKQSAEKIQQSPQFRHVQQIRHKLLCFINALQTHITSVALQGSWQLFQEQLQSVKSMEELYKKHTKYLKRVEFLCMLNKSSHEFYAKMEDIFVVVLRFCYNLQSKNWRCGDHGIYTHPKYDKLLTIESDFVKLIKFIIYAGQKMYRCGYQTEIGEFIHMINMNGYYDQK